jgi:hypothetical protein
VLIGQQSCSGRPFHYEGYIKLGIYTKHQLSYDCIADKPHTKEEFT